MFTSQPHLRTVPHSRQLQKSISRGPAPQISQNHPSAVRFTGRGAWHASQRGADIGFRSVQVPQAHSSEAEGRAGGGGLLVAILFREAGVVVDDRDELALLVGAGLGPFAAGREADWADGAAGAAEAEPLLGPDDVDEVADEGSVTHEGRGRLGAGEADVAGVESSLIVEGVADVAFPLLSPPESESPVRSTTSGGSGRAVASTTTLSSCALRDSSSASLLSTLHVLSSLRRRSAAYSSANPT